MPAVLFSHVKEIRDDGSIVEIAIWELAEPLPPSTHRYKYRLYYGAAGVARVRYDNERGKGDHRHLGRCGARLRFLIRRATARRLQIRR